MNLNLGTPLVLVTKAEREQNRARQTKNIKKALRRGPVPAGICDYLVFAVEPRRQDFAFAVVSHLIGACGWPPKISKTHQMISQKAFKALGAPRNNADLYKTVEQLIKAQIIVRGRCAVQQRGSGQTHEFGLDPWLIAHALSFQDQGNYPSLKAFAARKPKMTVARPQRGLDRELRECFRATAPTFLDVVRALQSRPLRFNRTAAQAWLEDPTTELDGKKREALWNWVQTVPDGPSYTSYTLAKTGRLHSNGLGYFQGVPRHLRRFYYAEPGYVFLDVDYHAQEPRLFAWLSGDEVLLADILCRDPEFYQQAAAVIEVGRDAAKAAVNAYFNGAGSVTMASQAFGEPDSVTPEQVDLGRALHDYLGERYRGVGRWIDRNVREIRKTRKAVACDGFVRKIKPGEGRKEGINHLVQGTGAALLRVILVELERRLGNLGRVIAPFHDGLLLEVREDAVDEVKAMVEHLMRFEATSLVPLAPTFKSRSLAGLELPVKFKDGWFMGDEPPPGANSIPAEVIAGRPK